jgi:F0F1-type ATP synthase delta subunit
MKNQLRKLALAQAVAELSAKDPNSDPKVLIDAALAAVQKHKLGTPRDFAKALQTALHAYEVRLRSAMPMSEKSQKGLDAVVSKAIGTPVHMKAEEEQTLVGGAILQVGDERFDASVLRMLKQAAKTLVAPL